MEPERCIAFVQARGWAGREGEETDASIREGPGQEGREREQKEVHLGFWDFFFCLLLCDCPCCYFNCDSIWIKMWDTGNLWVVFP